jgi:hypothetical protein
MDDISYGQYPSHDSDDSAFEHTSQSGYESVDLSPRPVSPPTDRRATTGASPEILSHGNRFLDPRDPCRGLLASNDTTTRQRYLPRIRVQDTRHGRHPHRLPMTAHCPGDTDTASTGHGRRERRERRARTKRRERHERPGHFHDNPLSDEHALPHHPVDPLTDQPTDQPADHRTDQAVDQPVDQPVHQMTAGPSSDELQWDDDQDDEALSFVEPVPLNSNENWGPSRKEDDWCFLCEKGDVPINLSMNSNFQTLTAIFKNPTGMQRHQMCRVVQAVYMEKFYPYQIPQRPWTLRGIRNHAENHGGMDHTARIRDMKSTMFICFQHVKQDMLRMKEKRTGNTWLSAAGMKHLINLANCYMRLDKEMS